LAGLPAVAKVMARVRRSFARRRKGCATSGRGQPWRAALREAAGTSPTCS